MLHNIISLSLIAYKGSKGHGIIKRATWFLYAVSNFGMILIMKWLYDTILQTATINKKIIFMAVILGINMILLNFFVTVSNIISEKSVYLFQKNLLLSLYKKMENLELIKYEDTNILNEINQAKTGIINACFLLNLLSLVVWYYIPYLLLVSYYYLHTSPMLIFILILIVFPIILKQIRKYKVNVNMMEQLSKCERKKEEYSAYFQNVSQVKESRIYNTGSYLLNLFQKNLYDECNLRRKKAKSITDYSLKMDLLSTLCYVCSIVILIFLTLENKMTIAELGAILSSIASVSSVLNTFLGSHIGKITSQSGKIKILMKYLNSENETENEGVKFNENLDSIEMRGVRFKYPSDKTNREVEFDCTFNKKEVVVIVGENGSGKSTFIKLLTGIYKPDHGEVLYNHEDISKFDKKSIFEKSSILLQNFSKYHLNISENVSLSDESEKNIEDILNKVDFDKGTFVQAGKTDTVLGKKFGGIDLSGGYWQRIAIARCIYKDSEIICLDEPTSAIDPLEESKLYELFSEVSKGKFAFIVSHRLGLCKIANRILVVKDGKIVEDGTHNELIKLNGTYKDLYEKQNCYS